MFHMTTEPKTVKSTVSGYRKDNSGDNSNDNVHDLAVAREKFISIIKIVRYKPSKSDNVGRDELLVYLNGKKNIGIY
jgi:hypothetical protein